jgi:hypothetical protein
MGPPMFVRTTFTTVPGRFGVTHDETDENPKRKGAPTLLIAINETPLKIMVATIPKTNCALWESGFNLFALALHVVC